MGPGCTVTVVDLARCGHDEQALADAYGAVHALGWTVDDDRHVQVCSVLRVMQHRRRPAAVLAPPSLLGLPPGDVVDLLLGRLQIVTTLASDRIERELARRGVRARIAGAEGWESRFLTCWDGRRPLDASPMLREQVISELTTLDTLARTLRVAMRAARDGVDGDVLLYADESRSWT